MISVICKARGADIVIFTTLALQVPISAIPRIFQAIVFATSRMLCRRSDRKRWRWDDVDGDYLHHQVFMSTSPVPRFVHLRGPFSIRCLHQTITLRAQRVFIWCAHERKPDEGQEQRWRKEVILLWRRGLREGRKARKCPVCKEHTTQ